MSVREQLERALAVAFLVIGLPLVIVFNSTHNRLGRLSIVEYAPEWIRTLVDVSELFAYALLAFVLVGLAYERVRA